MLINVDFDGGPVALKRAMATRYASEGARRSWLYSFPREKKSLFFYR